jgi:hypothetical protein
MKKNFFFWLLFCVLTLALMLPNLLSIGMFVDGVYYATISRNLAAEDGTFWAPVFTNTDSRFFWDHPPLVFGIESLFFRLLGDSYLVEKFYSFLTFVVTAAIISRIWKLAAGKDGFSWLPLILWLITPLTYWAYSNNMLENTMGIFCLGSAAILLYSWINKKNYFLYYILASILLTGGILSKGPFALFPLAIPFLYWISTRNIKFRDVLISTFILAVVPAVFIWIMLQFEPSRINLTQYFNMQILASLSGKRDLMFRQDHFKLFKELFNQFIPVLVFIGAVYATWRIWFRKVITENENRYALFFLLTGISASFPILLIPKQNIHYIICSIPFYALAASVLIIPKIKYWTEIINFKSRFFKIANYSLLFLLSAIIFFSVSRINTIGRDFDVLNDLKSMETVLPKGQNINCNMDILYDFAFKSYLCRYYKVGVELYPPYHDYFIINKKRFADAPQGFEMISPNTKNYFLFKRKKESGK